MKKFLLVVSLVVACLLASCEMETEAYESSETVEPGWLPESLRGLHPYNGTWSYTYTTNEYIYHTNFISVRNFIDELVNIIRPGDKGSNGENGHSYAYYLYYQNMASENTAKTYAETYYSDLLTLQNYLNENNILYFFGASDNSMDTTVNVFFSELDIYLVGDDGPVASMCISVSGKPKYGSTEKNYLAVTLHVEGKQRIGYKHGMVYTFTPNDGNNPINYDLRKEIYYDWFGNIPIEGIVGERPDPSILKNIKIISPDGNFLGTLNPDKNNPDSVYNQSGRGHNNTSNPVNTIMLKDRIYGSDSSDKSPFNKSALNAPMLVDSNGRLWGCLSVNKSAGKVTDWSYELALSLKDYRDSL